MAKNSGSKKWRNRVRELRYVQAAELKANPRNFRKHPERQTKALKGVLDAVGVAGALLAYEHPERGLELIDGHLRQEIGGEWPVLILDVTEAEANVLLATHDPIAAMAEQNNDVLTELIESLEIDVPGLEEIFAPPRIEKGYEVPESPQEFASYDESLETHYCCPKCGYEWSGKPK